MFLLSTNVLYKISMLVSNANLLPTLYTLYLLFLFFLVSNLRLFEDIVS